MRLRVFLIALLLCVAGSPKSYAIYAVRISDLGNSPVPPNPIRVWGTVTNNSPVKISDGRAEIAVTGVNAEIGDYLILTGDWDGSVLTVSAATGLIGPARMSMIYVPAGSFLMGNNGNEPYSHPNELPQHSVELPGYWIGKYEVTRGEYAQFISAGGYSNPEYWSEDGWAWKTQNSRTKPAHWDNPVNWGVPPGSWDQTDRHPVVGVTYYEAEAFCNWAGGHLPTEAQWEKAARWTGSYPNVYPWGNSWDAEKCNNWYDHNPAAGGYQYCQTAPVGSYPNGASPYACQDMAGNVWEWTQDWYKSYPGSQAPFDFTGVYRVLRGGGWGLYVPGCRCAYRYNSVPTYTSYYVGFRLAR